ncbi:Mak11 [Kluyveromyces lactis]|nr:Mak11 [Kluyveromyces lactis]
MPDNQFRIIVGSYEHNILCLSLNLSLTQPLFTPIFHFQAHSLSVKCLDISKRYLVSGSNDENIRIYDLQKRKELGTLLGHQGSITNLRFSRGKDADGQDIQLNKWLLSASEDHKIIVWRVKDWENFGTLKGHTARINDFDIHPSNRVAVSVSEDHSIRLWNLMTVKKAGVLKLRKYNQNGQFVRWCGENGSHIAVGLSNKLLIFKTETAKVHREIDFGRNTLMHLEREIIDGEEYIVVGLNSGVVQFWKASKLYEEVPDEKEESLKLEAEFSLLGHSNRVKDFQFYHNKFGHYLVTIGSDGRIVVWDMKTRDQVAVYDCGERLNCVAVCDESIEKYDTVKKRAPEEVEVGEPSDVEADPEELKKIMLGKKAKKSKKRGGNKKRKVEVQLE